MLSFFRTVVVGTCEGFKCFHIIHSFDLFLLLLFLWKKWKRNVLKESLYRGSLPTTAIERKARNSNFSKTLIIVLYPSPAVKRYEDFRFKSNFTSCMLSTASLVKDFKYLILPKRLKWYVFRYLATVSERESLRFSEKLKLS